MWGIPSRTKRGKDGTFDAESESGSWKWPKGEGFSGQIAGGSLGDLITFIVYCPVRIWSDSLHTYRWIHTYIATEHFIAAATTIPFPNWHEE